VTEAVERFHRRWRDRDPGGRAEWHPGPRGDGRPGGERVLRALSPAFTPQVSTRIDCLHAPCGSAASVWTAPKHGRCLRLGARLACGPVAQTPRSDATAIARSVTSLRAR
jgi:hypothetical protein